MDKARHYWLRVRRLGDSLWYDFKYRPLTALSTMVFIGFFGLIVGGFISAYMRTR